MLLSCNWSPLNRAWLHLLCTPSSAIYIGISFSLDWELHFFERCSTRVQCLFSLKPTASVERWWKEISVPVTELLCSCIKTWCCRKCFCEEEQIKLLPPVTLADQYYIKMSHTAGKQNILHYIIGIPLIFALWLPLFIIIRKPFVLKFLKFLHSYLLEEGFICEAVS